MQYCTYMHLSVTTDIFQALADETRLRCFRLLSATPQALCVAEFADILQKPQYAISRALGELRKSGLVHESRQGKLVFYRLSPDSAIQELSTWTRQWCQCSTEPATTNPDGSSLPGADPCSYDLERLVWRLQTRNDKNEIMVTYPKADPSKSRQIKILFVCVHNSARSQLAEAYLSQLGIEHVLAESAGLTPGNLNPYVVQVLAEEGINIAGKTTRSVMDLYRRGQTYQWVITVCSREAEENCPIFPGPVRRLSWPFPDPASFTGTSDEILTQVRHLAIDIKTKITLFANETILNQATPQQGVTHV